MSPKLILLFSLLTQVFSFIDSLNKNCFTNSNSFSNDALKFLKTSEEDECDPILVTSLIDSLRNSSIQAVFTDSVPDRLCHIVESLSQLYEKDVITRNCSWYSTSSVPWNRQQQDGSRSIVSGFEQEEIEDEDEGAKRKSEKRSPFVRISPSKVEYSLGYLHHFLIRNNVSSFIVLVIYNDTSTNNRNSSHTNLNILPLILSSFANWDQRQIVDGFILLPSHFFRTIDSIQPVISLLSNIPTECKYVKKPIIDPNVLIETRERNIYVCISTHK